MEMKQMGKKVNKVIAVTFNKFNPQRHKMANAFMKNKGIEGTEIDTNASQLNF